MRSPILAALAAFVSFGVSADALTLEQRKAHVDWMLQSLPPVPSWTEWQAKTQSLPPDFDALRSANFLPEPLAFQDGRPVKMTADWPARRKEIRELFEKWVVGTLPPKPKLDKVVPVEEQKHAGYSTRVVRLEYGPESKISSQVTLTLPEGQGPFPVLIGGGGWSNSLIRRGYAVCEFPSSVDQVTNLPELYPQHDFATMGQRAWTAQLVVDYLFTVPEIDKARIAITGYSRGGKMALLAGAVDERIAAVVAGSTGVGGVLAWRLSGERGMGEGIETTTRMFPLWFAPQLRFFSGREDRLPVDANLLVALMAPRGVLMEYGLNDEVSNVWGAEQTYHSAQKVYAALGQTNRLGLLRVPGFHGANDIEQSIDWLDVQFGRTEKPWVNSFLFPWSFEDWKRTAGKHVNIYTAPQPTRALANSVAELEQQNARVKKAVEWVLGSTPPTVAAGRGRMGMFPQRGPAPTVLSPVANPGQLAPDVAAWVVARKSPEFGWREEDSSAAASRRIRFAGGAITGDLFYPAGTPEGTKLPTVIWLHGYSYPLGYMWVYRRDIHPILALVKAGYAVLAYDQCGFGARMSEIGPFYDRYPKYSQLGRMVEDVRSAVDALQSETFVDPQQIHLFGYTIGGAVGLHAAAFDPRIKSVVAVSGFTPMRTDTASKPTGGLARFSVERPVAPRLGLFIGQESKVPYDYDELIAAIAPRPVYIVQPSMDRDATPADVRTAVETARKAYALHNAADRLVLQQPNDYQRMSGAVQADAIEWIGRVRTPAAGAGAP